MNFINKIKRQDAVTLTDVIIGMLILILFTGIITGGFYNIYTTNISIRMDAIAVDYSIKILEDIDKMKYEDVNNELNINVKQNYNIIDNYTVNIDVQNYNKDDETKQDIIKIVTVNVKYMVGDNEKNYTVKKLKIKEM